MASDSEFIEERNAVLRKRPTQTVVAIRKLVRSNQSILVRMRPDFDLFAPLCRPPFEPGEVVRERIRSVLVREGDGHEIRGLVVGVDIDVPDPVQQRHVPLV